MLVLGCALMFASCDSASNESTNRRDLPLPRGAAANQAHWRSLGIDDYRIVFERRNLNGMGGSSGDGIVTATVAGGEMTECIEDEIALAGFGPCQFIESTPVDKLFEWLNAFDPEYTNVEYEPEFGFPVLITFDIPDAADEEYRITVRSFRRLQS